MVTGFRTCSMMIQGDNHIAHMISCNVLRVLYCSLHRYDNAAFYPGSPDANYDMVGTNKGAGFNINVAWNWVWYHSDYNFIHNQYYNLAQ